METDPEMVLAGVISLLCFCCGWVVFGREGASEINRGRVEISTRVLRGSRRHGLSEIHLSTAEQAAKELTQVGP